MRIANKLTSLALLLAAPGLMAQESLGVLMGNIKDPSGKVLAGVTVKITSPNLMGERIQVTGADGAFRVPLLPPGNYSVVANLPNYVSQKANFYLNAGNSMRQDLVLRPISQAAAVVEVVASVAQVDKTDTSTKTNFSADDLEAITGFPSSGSIAYNTMTLAPGVVGGAQYASVRGGGQMATNYVVNGVSARDNVTGQARMGDYTLDDTIEDTSVIQSPLNAKYGGSSSGIVAVTTKRGSNEFAGTIRAKLSNLAWAATTTGMRNNLGQLAAGTSLPQTDQLSRTYELTFSGPIWKDHLTFMYATRLLPSVPNTATTFNPHDYELDYVRIPGITGVSTGKNYDTHMYNANTIESAVQKNTFHQFALFLQLNSDHSFEWNYAEGNDTNPDLQYNYVTPDNSITKVQTSNRSYYNLAYRGILSANQLVEFRYGRNRSDTQFTSGPGLPVLVMAAQTPATISDVWDKGADYGYNNSPMTHYGWFTSGGASDTQPDGRTTESIVANYNLQLEAKGSHNIDIGFERQQPIWATTARGNSAPHQFFTAGRISETDAVAKADGVAGKYIMFNYNEKMDGETTALDQSVYGDFIPQYHTLVGADQSKVRNPTDSVWINDLWTINSNWIVMAGLRYDNMKIKDAIGTRVDSKMVSPRFEIKWDVNGDQKRLVNFSYGKFRGLYSARFYRTFTEGRRNTEVVKYWTGGTGAFTFADVTNPANYGYSKTFTSSGQFKIDPSYKPEVNTEMVLGFTRSYDTGGHWKIAAVLRKWTDMTYVPGTPAILNVALPGTTLSTNTFARTLTNDPEAHRYYKAVEFEWLAPLTADLTFGGNYTFSRTTANSDFGDATGFTALETPTLAGWWRPQFDAAGISRDSYMPDGQTALSRNHVLKAYLTYKMDRGRTRSSVALQGSYLGGGKVNLTNVQNLTKADGTAVVLVPDPNGILNDLPPSTYTRFFNGRGQYSQPDYWSLNLQYNLEIKLEGTLRVFTNLSVNNILNSSLPINETLSGSGTNRSYAAMQQGFRTSTTVNYGIATSNGANFTGARSVSLDLGLKF